MIKEEFFIDDLAAANNFVIEQVYKANKEKFLNYALQYTITKDIAVDIYQDAIVALIEHAQKNKLQQINVSVSTYLFSIGKFMLYNYLKKNKPTIHFSDSVELIEWKDYDTIKEEQEVQLLQQYFLQLGDQCKKILTLFYYEEKKLDAIVQLMGYENKDTVKSQKSRCLKQLKNLIQNNHAS